MNPQNQAFDAALGRFSGARDGRAAAHTTRVVVVGRLGLVDVVAGPPPPVDAHDAWVITGSRSDAFADDDWIVRLVDWVVEARRHRVRVAGICFGHQLIAHFFGGEAGPAPVGWAVGVQTSDVVLNPRWMNAVGVPPSQLNLVSSHKDQVLKLPDGAEVFATSDFCEVSGFTMGNEVLTIQGHPELTTDYSQALMGVRRQLLGEEVYQAGIDSLQKNTDERLFTQWMLAFINDRASADERAEVSQQRHG